MVQFAATLTSADEWLLAYQRLNFLGLAFLLTNCAAF
jgi:hypothetical protein